MSGPSTGTSCVRLPLRDESFGARSGLGRLVTVTAALCALPLFDACCARASRRHIHRVVLGVFGRFGVSLRLGATALLAAGYDIEFVKVMGRWMSDAWRRYNRLDISTRQKIARAMQFSAKERTPFFFADMVVTQDELVGATR